MFEGTRSSAILWDVCKLWNFVGKVTYWLDLPTHSCVSTEEEAGTGGSSRGELAQAQ